MNNRLQHIFVSQYTSIRETMKKITGVAKYGAPAGMAIVIDRNKKLQGIITDGDIRRALVNDISIDSPVSKIMIKDPITVQKNFSETEALHHVTKEVMAKQRLHDSKVDKVIVLNEDGCVEDVLDFLEMWQASQTLNKKVCVIGLGFVGLTLAIGLSDVGFDVVGYDTNEDVVEKLKKGIPTFFEKGLQSLLKYHVINKNFKVYSKLSNIKADVYILSVGSPVKGKNKNPDLSYVKNAAKQIGKIIKPRDQVILRSTVPVGTTREVVKPIIENESKLRCGEDFYLSFAPERTIEGKALEELRSLPQVIGSFNERGLDVATKFFAQLNHTVVRVDSLEAAEMVKLLNNTFRDVSFGFANECAQICNRLNLDAVKVIEAANRGYPRNKIPLPSPGVGGICLKKDPYILISTAKKTGFTAEMPAIGRKRNEEMPEFVRGKIETFFKNNVKTNYPKLFIIGFAFKGIPETSDIRDSTTVDLVEIIRKKNTWKLFGYDPVAQKSDVESTGVKGCSLAEGFSNAHCALIMNNHQSYRSIDILGLLEKMRKPALFFDSWHLFPKDEIQRVKGITYGTLSDSN